MAGDPDHGHDDAQGPVVFAYDGSELAKLRSTRPAACSPRDATRSS